MEALRIGLEVVGILGTMVAAIFGVKQGIAVLEVKLTAVETNFTNQIAAVHQRIDAVHQRIDDVVAAARKVA